MLRRGVGDVRGVARAFIDRAGQVPQLQIEIDRAARRPLRPERRRHPGHDRDRARRQGRRPRSGKASSASASSSGCRPRRAPTPTPMRQIRVDTPDGAAHPAGGRRRRSCVRQGAMNISRESGSAGDGDRRLHPRPRHGQRRRGDAAAGRGERAPAAGRTAGLGRRVREPAARDGAAAADRAAQRLPDLRAAVRRVPVGASTPR